MLQGHLVEVEAYWLILRNIWTANSSSHQLFITASFWAAGAVRPDLQTTQVQQSFYEWILWLFSWNVARIWAGFNCQGV